MAAGSRLVPVGLGAFRFERTTSLIFALIETRAVPAVCRLRVSCLMFLRSATFLAMLFALCDSSRADQCGVWINGGRQGGEQLGPRGLPFGVLRARQLFEQCFAAARQSQHDFPASCS